MSSEKSLLTSPEIDEFYDLEYPKDGQKEKKETVERLHAIDITRGLIMLLMAIDHCKGIPQINTPIHTYILKV